MKTVTTIITRQMKRNNQFILISKHLNIMFVLIIYFTVRIKQINCENSDQLNNKTMEDCVTKAKLCSLHPTLPKGGVICGSDNHTYSNRCALMMSQCHNTNLEYKSAGYCQDPQPCIESLKYAQEMKRVGINDVFMPRCREDGRYAATQCNNDENLQNSLDRHCWCVTPNGLPISGTTVRTGRPKCGKKSDKKIRISRGGSRKPKQSCKRAERQVFNANLFKIFKSEWSRSTSKNPQSERAIKKDESVAYDGDKIILEWKFDQLDKNQNDLLENSEYKDLKIIVKKIIKPKKCARVFIRTCDMNRDQIVSKDEWLNCLSESALDDDRRTSENNMEDNDYNDANHKNTYQHTILKNDDEDFEEERGFDILRHPDVLQSTGPKDQNKIGVLQDYDRDDEEEELQLNGRNRGESDCLADRRQALVEQPASSNFYVPDCDPITGYYKLVQCYSTYCWCVYGETGKTIPGSTVKNAQPKCEEHLFNIGDQLKPMKGCPENRRLQFLKDFINYFSVEENSNKNYYNNENLSKDERIAQWIFKKLDDNSNSILERKEWKQLRAIVSSVKNLRHCGKKLPRYCDVNKDKRITKTEWWNCLGMNNNKKNEFTTKSTVNINKITVENSPKISRSRNGLNPLEFILKSD